MCLPFECCYKDLYSKHYQMHVRKVVETWKINGNIIQQLLQSSDITAIVPILRAYYSAIIHLVVKNIITMSNCLQRWRMTHMFDITFYSRGEQFHPTCYVNSQNIHMWLMENHHKTSFHWVKTHVLHVVSYYMTAGHIFFENTINSEHYTVKCPWIPLTSYWRHNFWSMILTRQHIMLYSTGNCVCVNRVVLEPNHFQTTMVPCSSDLSVWGHISSNTYQNKACNLDMKSSTSNINADISSAMPYTVSANKLCHTQLCMQPHGAGANLFNKMYCNTLIWIVLIQNTAIMYTWVMTE
jgi:hypothetical protein